MNNVICEYRLLLKQYLTGEMNVDEFQATYLDRFKKEEREYPEPLYEILDELFGEVDSYTKDNQLLLEQPDFYLNEKELKEKVAQKVKQLEGLVKLE